MTTALALAHRTPARLVRDVLGLFKLRIGVMIMLTALVGGPFFFWLIRRERASSGGWA